MCLDQSVSSGSGWHQLGQKTNGDRTNLNSDDP
jgi:hypothetical protein